MFPLMSDEVFPTRVGMSRPTGVGNGLFISFPYTRRDEPGSYHGMQIQCEVFPTRVGMSRRRGGHGIMSERFSLHA